MEMDIDNLIGKVFADSLMEILSVTAGFYHTVLSEERDNEFEELTSVMQLKGKKLGVLFISAKKDAIRVLCSCMTGIPQNEISRSDIEDSLCEIMNMTAGSAKLRLGNSEYVYELTTPILLSGQNISITTKKRTHVVCRKIGNEEISIRIKVVY